MITSDLAGMVAQTYRTRGYPIDLELRRAAQAGRRARRGRLRRLANRLIGRESTQA